VLELVGRTALVTGASRGLGRAVARQLAAAGCHVLVNYAHRDEDAAQTVKELAELPGGGTALRADVRDRDAVAGMLDEVGAQFGGLDIAVHNVSSAHPGPLLRARVEDLHADLATALNPLLYSAGRLAQLMAGRSGRIVAVSNSGARRVIPHLATLGLAKAALESLVRYLAVELADRDIAVNAVATGKLDKGDGSADPALLARLAGRCPSGRLTRPEDVAGVVALLCTAPAGWIRGQVITVDGGLGLMD
jgi:enoyl-[acyl-carrier protein] reductase III